MVIPAKNEAATIAAVIEAVRSLATGPDPLVHEIVVIDSDSSDDTADVARAAGATVHAAAAIRPDLGTGHGKGEAIWKSQFVTRGDLLVFLDADVTNVTSSFVTDLLHPLMRDERICLAKAFYDRDLADEQRVQPGEGGRVTELLARPAIALWWPELAGIVQPLAGEWAIRRSLLEQCTLPCGYGVELAILIDTYERLGIDAIAQVDLGRREHRHQDLQALGAMSLEILAALVERLPEGDRTPPRSITQPTRTAGAAGWTTRPVNVGNRPPAASVASVPTTE